MPLAVCPGCDEYIQVSQRAEMGDLVACPKCGAELEVVGMNPVELDWADYDDDDEDLDYDYEEEDEDEDEEEFDR